MRSLLYKLTFCGLKLLVIFTLSSCGGENISTVTPDELSSSSSSSSSSSTSSSSSSGFIALCSSTHLDDSNTHPTRLQAYLEKLNQFSGNTSQDFEVPTVLSVPCSIQTTEFSKMDMAIFYRNAIKAVSIGTQEEAFHYCRDDNQDNCRDDLYSLSVEIFGRNATPPEENFVDTIIADNPDDLIKARNLVMISYLTSAEFLFSNDF